MPTGKLQLAFSLVHPMGIEPISPDPESGILSIELRVRIKWSKNTKYISFYLNNLPLFKLI